MGASDAELIDRWRRGEVAAFEALVRRWQEPVARFLARMGHAPELVQDLCQEVFLRLYLAGRRYERKAAFSTWLYHIALNVARDAVRRRRRYPEPLHDREPEANGTPAETRCVQSELARDVTEALGELPEPQRLVLVLRHYEGLSFEAIARLTGTPPSTLKSRFAAALMRLRDRLRGWEETL